MQQKRPGAASKLSSCQPLPAQGQAWAGLMSSHAVAAVLGGCDQMSAAALPALLKGCAGLPVPSAVAAVQQAVTAMQGRGG